MSKRRFVKLSVWLLSVGCAMWLGAAIGQQGAPTENKGIEAQVVSTLILDRI